MLLAALALSFATAPQDAATPPQAMSDAAYRQLLEAVAAEAGARGDRETAKLLTKRAAAVQFPASTPATPAPPIDPAQVSMELMKFQHRLLAPQRGGVGGHGHGAPAAARDSAHDSAHGHDHAHDSNRSSSSDSSHSSSSDSSQSSSSSSDSSHDHGHDHQSEADRRQAAQRAARIRTLEKEVERIQELADTKRLELERLRLRQPASGATPPRGRRR